MKKPLPKWFSGGKIRLGKLMEYTSPTPNRWAPPPPPPLPPLQQKNDNNDHNRPENDDAHSKGYNGQFIENSIHPNIQIYRDI